MPIYDTDAFPPALRAKTFKPNIIVLPFEELRSVKNGQNYVRISQTPESMNAAVDPAFDPVNFRVDDNMFPVGSIRSIRERGDNSDIVYLDGQKWLRMGAFITADADIAAVDNKDALLGMGQYSIGYTAAQTGIPATDEHFREVVGNGSGVWLAYSLRRFFRSTDDGITWTALGDVTDNRNWIYGLATDGEGTWWFLSTDGFISSSTNNGTSWTVITQTSIPIVASTGTNLFKYSFGNLYFIPATQITVSTPTTASAIAAYKFNLYDATWSTLTYDSNLLYVYSNNVAAGVSCLGSWHDLVETNDAIYLQGRFTASSNRYLMHLIITKGQTPSYAGFAYTGFISGNNNTTLVDAGNVVWANTCTYNTPTSAYVQRKAWLAKDLTTFNTVPGVPSPLASTFFYYTSGDILDGLGSTSFKHTDVFYKYGTTVMPRGSACLSRSYFNDDVQTSSVQTGTIVSDSDFTCAGMAGDTIVQMCTLGRVVRHRPHIGTQVAYKTTADMASYIRIS